MSAASYLRRITEAAVLRDAEKASVDRSLTALRSKLRAHFGDGRSATKMVKAHFAFGSYTRGTILPRSMDPQSDVDYMIVFEDADAKPQTCLDRVRRFVEDRYPRAEIAQSHPTIVLALNHIRFELVPAIETFWSGIQIPGKGSFLDEWITTTPNEFNAKLTAKNQSNENLIKPLVRALKYWNALNDYPFESFKLEQMVVDHLSIQAALFGADIWERFAWFVDDLSASWSDPAYKKAAIERAKDAVAEVRRLADRGEEAGAEAKLKRLLPEV